MQKRPFQAILVIGATCAVTGAAMSGIATSSAATKAPAAAAATAAATPPAGMRGDFDGGPGGGGHRGGGGHGGGGRGGVHSESVRPDPDGTGFITTVEDSGTVTAIDGTTLTVKEGTATETFDTVKVTVDGTVTVDRNRAASKLSAVKVGDHVRVSKDGTNTRIEATTAAFEKAQDAQRAQHEQQDAADATWPKA
ncbi:MAG: hypothetical protein JWM98_1573 [Thermoleophilia bacterium]|nr:hypothetical protein [Thermoleophilia bacterium]